MVVLAVNMRHDFGPEVFLDNIDQQLCGCLVGRAQVFPELVVFNSQGQPETVKYRLLSSLLLNELQKQQQQLNGQVAEISELKNQLTELSEVISQMAGSVGHVTE